MPVRIIITEGPCADIRQTYTLIEGLSPKVVIADRAYSAKSFRNQLKEADIQAVIQRSNEATGLKNSMIKNCINALFH